MTNTSSRLPVRVRAFLQLTAVALLVLAVMPGCGTSDNNNSDNNNGGSPGGGGSAGSTGKAGAGTTSGGTQSSAGTTSAGNAGSANGGGSAGGSSIGGSSMTGEAGASEAGAPAAVCGNGIVEPGEECDDGNTVDEDGCSSICTNKCEKCEAAANCFTKYDLSQPCKSPADCRNRENEATSFDFCYGTHGQAPAASGPAAGTSKAKLCQAVIACVRRTNCITNSQDSSLTSCYCGDEPPVASPGDPNPCEATPHGACAEEIADAAEARSLQVLSQVSMGSDATAPGFAAAAAENILFNCDASACVSECFQDKTPTTCAQCAIGSNAHDQNLLCPDYNNCYFGTDSTVDNQTILPTAKLCSAAVDCALSTGCGANGAESCYGNGAGPCAAQFAAAANSMDPVTVVDRIRNTSQAAAVYPSSTAQSLLACEAAHCSSTCFPNGAGGSGGSGGAGTGGTSAGTGGSSSGAGGTSAGTGGSSSGAGGASAGTAGSSGASAGTAGTAGASVGTGGSSGA